MKTRHISLTILAVIVTAALWISCREQVSDSSQNPVASGYEEAIVDPQEDVTAEPISNADSGMQGATPQVAKVLTPDVVSRLNSQDTTETVLLEVPGASVTVKGHQIGLHGKTFTARALSEEELHPLGGMCVNVTGGSGKGYRMLPSGEHFNPPAELRVSYNDSLIPLGYKPEDIFTSYYDESTHQWTRLHRVDIDTVNHEIVSLTTHFTDFVNEVLQAPEMPEAQAFVPTMMSDIEANPMDGLSLIQPPSANNNGTANVSYSLDIPAGRGGMQPQLTLSYSSQLGNSWLGVGWDISIPSITVETRWGVPRYDNRFESEVYLLEGEQLVTRYQDSSLKPMPHRTNKWEERQPDGTRFWSRIEECPDSIVRHGTSPSNYWWSVTHANGVTDFYGARDGSFNASSVLRRDSDGAIAEWHLTESVDPYGNKVRYYYDIVNPGGHGKQIYLSRIDYTGHDNSQGCFEIRFIRKSGPRPDIETSGRYGFLSATAATLCRVEAAVIDSTGTDYTVRKAWYFFTDTTRASQYKTRLTDLVCVATPEVLASDHCGHPIDSLFRSGKKHAVRYKFDYYDYPSSNSLFSDTVTFNNLPNDNVQSDFSLSSLLDICKTTALGASKGKSWNVGGTVSAGFGPLVCFTSASLGGNYNYNNSASEGLLTLVDIDGDGLVDKVFKKNNKIYYRKQIGGDDALQFSPECIMVRGLSDFLKESTTCNAGGVQAAVGLIASGNWSSSRSTTSVYLADINGDGLIDAVTEKGPLFNNLDGNGHPTFSSLNELLPNVDEEDDGKDRLIVIPSTSSCDGGIIYDGEVDPNVACIKGTDCPRSVYQGGVDAVQVWMAPQNGIIKLEDQINLIEDTSVSRRQCRFADGVRYVVELHKHINASNGQLRSAGNTVIVLNGIIEGDDYNLRESTLSNIEVSAGDLLMFRLQSLNDANYDNTRWHHRIQYVSTPGNGNNNNNGHGNGNNNNGPGNGNNNNGPGNTEVYDSHDDYVLTGEAYFLTPTRGTVTISDTVRYGGQGQMRYICRRQRGTSVLDSLVQQFSSNSLIVNRTFTVDSNDTIVFSIVPQGNHPVKWGSLRYHPHLTFVGNIMNTDPARYDTVRYNPLVRLSLPQVVDPYAQPSHPGHGFGLINNHRPVESRTLRILRQLVGPLYKGWGHFGYRSEGTDVTSPINLTQLVLPDFYTTQYTEDDTSRFDIRDQVDSTSSLQDFNNAVESVYSPLPSSSNSNRWVEMMPSAEHEAWMAFSNTARVGRRIMSNSRPPMVIPVAPDVAEVEEIEIYEHPVPVSTTGMEVKTIRKSSDIKTENYSFGANFAYVSLVGSRTNVTNTTNTDYMDLNGDRYPDIVGPSFVQFSKPWGGIGELSDVVNDNDLSVNKAESGGVTLGGSYPSISRQPSQNPKAAKSALDCHGNTGVSAGQSRDSVSYMMMDINGDGLPDMVYSDGLVRLNVGYGFSDSRLWHNFSPRTGESVNIGGSIGGEFSISQYSISGGLGGNWSANSTESTLLDVNGDGLLDMVEKRGGNVKVRYNKGAGAWSAPEILSGVEDISKSRSFNESLDIGATGGFTLWGVVKLCVGLSGSPYNKTFSSDTAQLVDINGDGYADYVTSNSESNMTVRYNLAGKTNLLRKVTNFTGASFTLGYDMPPASFDKPQRTWTLTTIETSDPAAPDSSSRTLTTFSYRNPRYDRYERTDYGFDTVITCQHHMYDGRFAPYRYTIEGYNNRSYNRRGRKTSDMIEDAEHRPYIETLYNTRVTDHLGNETDDTVCPGDVYVSKLVEIRRYYEGHPTPGVVTRTETQYDRFHNITRYIDHGDTTRTTEYYAVDVTYHSPMGNNMVSMPESVTVTDIDEEVLRSRSATYDAYGGLASLSVNTGSRNAITDYQRDEYGNITQATLPPNQDGERMFYAYTYDSVAHAYPIAVEDAFESRSNSTYDVFYGKPLTTTEINGNTVSYEYDAMGRLTHVSSPHQDGGYINIDYGVHNYDTSAVRVSSEPWENCSGSLVKRYDVEHPFDAITTAVSSDGWGRGLQTRKRVEINGQAAFMATTTLARDGLGRETVRWQPFRTEGDMLRIDRSYYFEIPSLSTHTSYDVLDRPVSVRQPYGYTSTMEYDFADIDGSSYFSTVTTDPNGVSVTAIAGSRGQKVANMAPLGAVTTFEYSPLGEILSSTDPEHNVTEYTYDLAGRLISRRHPDAGIDTYVYDAAGNLVERQNQMLADAGRHITYKYNFNRLTQVHYPERPANDVYYTYGTSADTTFNQVGRVVMIEDAAGWKTFKYGKLGEVTEETRALALPHQRNAYSFTMKYSYDSWNRIQDIIYPDGEKVSYHYAIGGDLRSIGSRKGQDTISYVDSIHYDGQNLRSHIWYGNNSHVSYTYDDLMRLSTLHSTLGDNQSMQTITYSYDPVGNILGIANNAGQLSNSLGGTYSNTYAYDSLYRLSSSQGTSGDVANTGYQFKMFYSPSGRILLKNLNANVSVSSAGLSAISNDFHYTYLNEQPHAVAEVRDYASDRVYAMKWNANGNLIYVESNNPQSVRRLCWSEENRLSAVADEDYVSHYLYDLDGERTMKLWGNTVPMDVNAGENRFANFNEYTVYPSPYVVADVHGYTKHYYAGTERLCSRIGGGGLQELHYSPMDDGYVEKKENAYRNLINEDLRCAGARAETKELKFEMLHRLSEIVEPETKIYYYHSDHLGSASWITDSSGQAVQHMQYLPYGETKLDQRTSSYHERYTFTGKEKDSETGYYYFGARYYNPDLSLWLSVDPMSDKYPSLSPYNYCAWNPMKLVDPDGGEINPVYGSDGGFRGCTKEGFTGQIIIYDGNLKFDDLSEKELYQKDNNAMPLDIAYGGLSSESKSKIYTNVMSNFEGDDILGTTFSMSDVKDGKIYHKDGDCNFATTYDSEGKLGNNSIIYATDKFFQAYEATVENLASSLICHEWFSHKIQGCSDKDRNHQQAYINVKNGPYWGKTTESYKEFINKKINKYEGR